jgi:hypothetical protein
MSVVRMAWGLLWDFLDAWVPVWIMVGGMLLAGFLGVFLDAIGVF